MKLDPKSFLERYGLALLVFVALVVVVFLAPTVAP